MSCEISPTTRKPFWVRYTVYLFLNSGAPVELSHWVKNHDSCCPDACSATLRKSSTVTDFPAYCVTNVAHGLIERLIADDPAQHLQDHPALVGDQGLKLG